MSKCSRFKIPVFSWLWFPDQFLTAISKSVYVDVKFNKTGTDASENKRQLVASFCMSQSVHLTTWGRLCEKKCLDSDLKKYFNLQ